MAVTQVVADELITQLNEPDWLTARRRAAWGQFVSLAMPSAAEELWRRTDVSRIQLDQLHPQPGRLNFECPDEARRQGVIAADLALTARERRDLIEPHLSQIVRPEEDKFTALASALWNPGSFISIPRGTILSQPILVSYVYPVEPDSGLYSHSLIIVEEGAEAYVINELSGCPAGPPAPERAPVSVSNVEIVVRPGAKLHYFYVQDWPETVKHFVTQRVVLEQDAELTSVSIGLGGRLTKANLQTRLMGAGARSELLGILFGDHEQHFDHYTLQEHLAPKTVSDLLFKVVLKHQARSVFLGLIKLEREAQQAEAFQTNQNLLLDQGTKADSIPMLEIKADDVRCKHAATVGPVDAEQKFYLNTRGLSEDEAEAMIVHGFFDPVIQRIPNAPMQERLIAYVDRKLGEVSVPV